MYENIFTGLQRRTISGGISETKFYRYNHNMQISKNVESMSAMRRNWSIVRRQQFGGVSQMSSLLAWPIKTIGLVVGVVLSASAAQAATVTLNFGNSPGSYHPYQESGYNVSASANGTGSVVLDDSTGQCPFADPAILARPSSSVRMVRFSMLFLLLLTLVAMETRISSNLTMVRTQSHLRLVVVTVAVYIRPRRNQLWSLV
jgi:hypothetical protein